MPRCNLSLMEDIYEFSSPPLLFSGEPSIDKSRMAIASDFDPNSRWFEDRYIRAQGEDVMTPEEFFGSMNETYGIGMFLEDSENAGISATVMGACLKGTTQLPADCLPLVDTIDQCLVSLFYSRFANGHTENFWELCFLALKGGGVPVGWEGVYPEGRLKVYVPASRVEAVG